jgi:nucleotide-binding universal stress UspA family protein
LIARNPILSVACILELSAAIRQKESLMSWKRMIVHCKAYQEWSPANDVAIDLARRHGARLTGLYTIRELAMLKLVFGSDHNAVREAALRDAPLTEKAGKLFLDCCAAAGVAAEWDVGEGNATELLSLAGRCSDLVVVEQSPGGLDGLTTDIVEECAVSCGTPTLIVPSTGSFPGTGRNVVIAWNHSRQSAVATQAALPIIAAADKVTVLIGRERDVLSSVTRRPRSDVTDYLKAHCSNVEAVKLEATDGEAGREILNAVARAGGDILIMGAYGRSSWREFLFGGATRYVISNLDVPVLMAH